MIGRDDLHLPSALTAIAYRHQRVDIGVGNNVWYVFCAAIIIRRCHHHRRQIMAISRRDICADAPFNVHAVILPARLALSAPATAVTAIQPATITSWPVTQYNALLPTPRRVLAYASPDNASRISPVGIHSFSTASSCRHRYQCGMTADDMIAATLSAVSLTAVLLR